MDGLNSETEEFVYTGQGGAPAPDSHALSAAEQLETLYDGSIGEIAKLKELFEQAKLEAGVQDPLSSGSRDLTDHDGHSGHAADPEDQWNPQGATSRDQRQRQPHQRGRQPRPQPPPAVRHDRCEDEEQDEWHAFFSSEHGDWYFSNMTTGETTWDKPKNVEIDYKPLPVLSVGALVRGQEDEAEGEEEFVDREEEESEWEEKARGEHAWPDSSTGDGCEEDEEGAWEEQELPSSSRQYRSSHTEHEREQLSSDGDSLGSPVREHHRAMAVHGNSQADRLMQKQQEYDERREEMRRAQLEREEAELRKQPVMNKRSKALLERQSGPQKSLAERSKERLMLKKQKEAQLKQELEEREAKELRHKPKINRRSKKMQRQVEDMESWNQSKESKLEVLARQREEQEAAECTFQPQLTKHSEKILQQRQRRGESSTPRKVEERLIEQAEVYREKREIAVQRQADEARQTAVPELAPHSANLPRKGDVADRLYGIAQKNKAKKEQAQRREKINSKFDEKTGQMLYQPKINKVSAAMARGRRPASGKVEDGLVEAGQQYQHRQLKRVERENEAARRKQETVKISLRSEMIADQLEERTQISASERLSKPIGVVKQSTLDTIPQYSFKPKLNDSTNDVILAHHRLPSSEPQPIYETTNPYGDTVETLRPPSRPPKQGPSIAERSAIWEKKKAAKEEALRREQDAKAQSDCTFAPRVSKKSSRQPKMDGLSMYERQEAWQKKRREKIETERRAKAEEEMASCPFTPRDFSGDSQASGGKRSPSSTRKAKKETARGSRAGGSDGGRSGVSCTSGASSNESSTRGKTRSDGDKAKESGEQGGWIPLPKDKVEVTRQQTQPDIPFQKRTNPIGRGWNTDEGERPVYARNRLESHKRRQSYSYLPTPSQPEPDFEDEGRWGDQQPERYECEDKESVGGIIPMPAAGSAAYSYRPQHDPVDLRPHDGEYMDRGVFDEGGCQHGHQDEFYDEEEDVEEDGADEEHRHDGYQYEQHECDQHQHQPPAPPPRSRSQLPPGWLQFTTEDGVPYFYNVLEGSTVWSLPKEEVPADSQPPPPPPDRHRDSQPEPQHHLETQPGLQYHEPHQEKQCQLGPESQHQPRAIDAAPSLLKASSTVKPRRRRPPPPVPV